MFLNSRKRLWGRIGLLSVGLIVSATAWAAGTNYVSLDGSHTAPYASWATAATNIQTAVDYACADIGTYDTVLVSSGTYYAPAAAGIRITNALTVKSQQGREETLVHGQGLTEAIFTINHAQAVLDGFTITNGPVRGIYLYNGTVQNCAIVSNRISGANNNGAGIYMTGGIVQDSIISNNLCNYLGGGIGAVYNQGIKGQVIRCQIMNNRVDPFSGGGVFGTLILRNCLIANNICGNEGGGVYGAYLINCTVVSNHAVNNVGGGTRLCYLTNCIVYFNADKDGNNMSADFAVAYTCSDPLPAGVGNIDADPQFVNPSAGDYRLRYSSPAVDAGLNWTEIDFDLDGNLRPQSGHGQTNAFDMGCYELPDPSQDVFQCWLTADPNVSLSMVTSTCQAFLVGPPEALVITNYHWDFGDGHQEEGADKQTVAHVFDIGEHTITLTVYNDQGRTASYRAVRAVRVQEGTFYVAPGGMGTYPHVSWAEATGDIREALRAAEEARQQGVLRPCVLISNGVYTLSSSIMLTNPVILCGYEGSAATSIQGSNLDQAVFVISNAQVVLDGLTISQGSNRGLEIRAGTVQNCAIVANQSTNRGGGIYLTAGLVSNCLVAHNYSSAFYSGGGIHITGGQVVDSVISHNRGAEPGGGVLGAQGGSGTLVRCRIVHNSNGHYGGGAVCDPCLLRNCLIAHNASSGDGAINASSLVNCTVVSNGTISQYPAGTHNCALTNCIVYFNTNANGTSNISGANVVYTCAEPKPAGDTNIGDDPLFVVTPAGDFLLSAASLARGAGTTNDIVDALDLMGAPRIHKGLIDMGAYQWWPPAGTVVSFY